jgi:hypothetical protein
LPKIEVPFLFSVSKTVCLGDILESVPRQAVVSQLDNPVWPNPNQQARTELCTQGGNKLRGAKGMANCRP